jgi:hypothetical protein
MTNNYCHLLPAAQHSTAAPEPEDISLPSSLNSVVDIVHTYSQEEVLCPLSDAGPALQSFACNLPHISDISHVALTCVAQMKPLQDCLEADTSWILPQEVLTLGVMQAKLDGYVGAQQQALDDLVDKISAMNAHATSAVQLFNYLRQNQDQLKTDHTLYAEVAKGLEIEGLAQLQPYQAYERIGQRWNALERDCIAAQLVWLRAMLSNTRLTFFMAVGSCVAANAQWLRDDGLEETGYDLAADQDWRLMFDEIREQPFRTAWPRSWGVLSEEGIGCYFTDQHSPTE